MEQNIKKFRTRSGLNFAMNEHLYLAVLADEQSLTKMECHIMAGEFFSQIISFLATLILLFNRQFSFVNILSGNVFASLFATLIWFIVPLYKIPGVSVIITLLGQTFFRFCLHIITIIVLSFAVFSDWKIILFCLISGGIASILNPLVFGYQFSLKRNNNIAKYVLK